MSGAATKGPCPPSVAEYLASLRASERFGPQVAALRDWPPEPTCFAMPAPPLPPELVDLLATLGIKSLYSHQARAIECIRTGRHVVTATPTASGKSLIYNLPVLAELLANPEARALYLFPLKALAQDQIRIIEAMAALLPALFEGRGRQPAAIYDGDTSTAMRRKIRDHLPGILVSNPDMLHLALLPYHDRWGQLFANLRHVIIDEVHSYSGVFGSHMAWLLRRLRRVCALYGSRPTFVLSSATIGNPGEHAATLLGEEVEVIEDSGAPRAKRSFALMNPEDTAPHAATMLLEAAVKRGLRTIVYTRSRKMTELVTMWTDRRLGTLKGRVSSYRAGFLPEDRRRIEARLADGELLGVISTSALELGIDIGGLDICILVGYPGSMMATWQRGGRVGRDGRESLVVLVAQEDALDQHFMRHPGEFFARSVEAVVINPGNPTIMAQHLLCAAAEQPLTADEPLLAEQDLRLAVHGLADRGGLLCGADGAAWFSPRKYPQREVNLRGSGRAFVIRRVDTGAVIGEIDGLRALKDCHPGAVYLHLARTWLVEELDIEARQILLRPANPHYFTRVLADKQTSILSVEEEQTCGAAQVCFGRLRVTETISAFQKRLRRGSKLIDTLPLDLPPSIFETEGLWIEIPERLREEIEADRRHFMGGIHAMEHGIIAMMPLQVLCDRNDLGGISHPWHEQVGGSAVFVYDGHDGGIGLCRRAFSRIEALLCATRDMIAACGCDNGCPSCVHSPKCGSGNRPLDREASLRLLGGILDREGSARPTMRRIAVKEAEAEGKGLGILQGLRYAVFDLETRRSAEEVGGWHRAEQMGVSVGVVFDSETDEFTVYREGEVEDLVAHLRRVDLVVGFNNRSFDNQVLRGYGADGLADLPTLDLLEIITNRLGYRVSLDRLAEHSLGTRKSGSGLLALRWFKEGRWEELIDYCRQDVRVTRDLFLFGLEKGYLLFQNKAGKVVRLPLRLDLAIDQAMDQALNPAPAPQLRGDSP